MSDEHVKRYHEIREKYPVHNMANMQIRELLKEKDKAIKELQSEVERLRGGGWISVDDRLPPEGIEIDFHDKHSGVICGMYGDHHILAGDDFAFHDLQDEQPSFFFHVTHWRERPEPPK